MTPEERKQLVMETGNWLGDQLDELGCDPQLRFDICFALGQRQAMLDDCEDFWHPARTAFENYKKGIWDKPGEELALRLCMKKFKDKSTVMKWLQEHHPAIFNQFNRHKQN